MSEFDDFIASTSSNIKASLNDEKCSRVERLEHFVLPILQEATEACQRQKIGFRLNLGWLDKNQQHKERIEFSCVEMVSSDSGQSERYIFGPLLKFTVEESISGCAHILCQVVRAGEDAEPCYPATSSEIKELAKMAMKGFLFEKERFKLGST